jgi:hemerythrin-like domain-containing protein
MNIINALVAHHTVLRQLYQHSENNPDMFEEFIRHLIVHHTMEEKYFYDLLEEIGEAQHDALEAVNEHHIIELIIKDSETFPREHERFPIKVEGLGEYTTHHLDEEEMEIFPMAQKLFSEGDLNALGKLFEEAKDKLLGVVLPEVPKTTATRGSGSSKVSPASISKPAAAQATAHGLGIGSLKK